jgi:hypothetical protein
MGVALVSTNLTAGQSGIIETSALPGGALAVTAVGPARYLRLTDAKADKAMWEFDLPDTYTAGAAISVTVNASISGSGTLTAASCTMALAAYSEVNGIETALTVTGGTQQIVAAGSNLTWTVAGTGLVAGSHVALELTQLITTASGANTGAINSVGYQA